MSIKNRPTLKTQFTNFINRLAPFAGNPLIQKTEHDQVIQDHLDSQLLKIDESLAVVTASTMNIDASASDLFIIDTGAAGTAARTININNLETGQRVRVEITKKTGDTFTVGSSEWWPVTLSDGSVVQVGLTELSFEAWNLNRVIRLSLLKPNIGGVSADGVKQFRFKTIDIGDWDMDATGNITVAHGLTFESIRTVDVTIRNDLQTLYQNLNFYNTTSLEGGGSTYDATNVNLFRIPAGVFDSTFFDSTSFNRGWITIM